MRATKASPPRCVEGEPVKNDIVPGLERESSPFARPTPDDAAELASRLTAIAGELSDQGTEVVISVQRVPVKGWRYLRPLVKVICRAGKPV